MSRGVTKLWLTCILTTSPGRRPSFRLTWKISMLACTVIPSPSTLAFPLYWHLYLVYRYAPSLPLHLAPVSFLSTLTFHLI